MIKKMVMFCVILNFISNHAFCQPIDQSYQGANYTSPSQTPNMFYGGFVSNDGNYPANYGSLFGFTYSSNGYGYSYQIFKGHTESRLYIRFADYSNGGNTWFSWKKILDSGNDIESLGQLKINGTGNNYINGNVGIGTVSPEFKLDVCGTIRAREVKVDLLGTCVPDFVFKKGYKLMELTELEKFVKTNQHLPEIDSEKEMAENGVNMKDMQMKLLQKIEELTLYTIEQNKKIEQLQKENIELKELKERIDRLEVSLKE